MVVQLESYVAVEENPDQELQNQQYDDPYEAEETLSLCDLPTHDSDSAHWEADFSKEYQCSSFDTDDQVDNYFEFFSGEFTASTYASEDNKDIIFCGKKLIAYTNESPDSVAAEKKKTTSPKNKEPSGKSSTKKWGLFRWRRFRRRSKPKVVTTKYYKPSSQVKDGRKNRRTSCDPSLWKVSVLSGNRSRSKWHLFMFGITKFPTEIELRDMKRRQTKRSPSTMFGATTNCEASKELMGKGNNEEISSENSKSNRRAKGLWGLLRVIGCSSRHSNGLVF